MYFYALHLTLTLTTISLHLVIIRVALQVYYEYVDCLFFFLSVECASFYIMKWKLPTDGSF